MQPSQDITVFYDAPDNLAKIIEKYAEFIYTTTKQPLRKYPVKPGEIIIKEKTKVHVGKKLKYQSKNY